MSKRCTRCHQWKDHSKFYKDKSKLDGLKSHCKDCHEAYKRDYRARPGARALRRRLTILRVRAAGWRPRFNESPLFFQWQASLRARRQANREAFYRKHFARRPGEAAIWNAANHESVRAVRQERRAQIWETPVNTLSGAEWQWILEKHHFKCAYCGQEGEGLTPDHVVPLSRGGANSLSNIVPACGPCNLKKGPRTPDEAGMPLVVNVSTLRELQQLNLI